MKHLRYFHRTCNFLSKNPLSFYTNNLRRCSTNSNDATKKLPLEGPNLNDFIQGLSQQYTQKSGRKNDRIPYLKSTSKYGYNRKVYFDIYGCQMNVNDTEVIWSILKKNNFVKTNVLEDADVILVVTCAIRDGAEKKIWNKLQYLKGLKNIRAKNKGRYDLKIGILGCMAERLKHQLIEKEKAVDIVAGPDSYRDLPRLLALTENNQTAVNVLLSMDETYADIVPVRLNENSISAYVSIMRGCDNMCTYCIVPFTRGRERSRPTASIVEEVQLLSQQGVKEVTLLGQNVNSYRDLSESNDKSIETNLAKGFKTVYKTKKGGRRFADLLDQISSIDPEMRIRFTSPHPKDFPDEVLQLIRERPNICKSLHLPAQSGSSTVLERMRRGYTREAYLELVEHVRNIIPNVALSSDFICGFCGESDKEFSETLSLIETVKYNMAYLFAYSMREKTTAYRRYEDDVPHDVKTTRLQQMINLYRNEVVKINQSQIGQHQLILIEGPSRRSNSHLAGRNDANIKVIIPNEEIPIQNSANSNLLKNITVGDYVVVQINSANSQVLKGIPLYHTTLTEYHNQLPNAGYNLEYCEYKL